MNHPSSIIRGVNKNVQFLLTEFKHAGFEEYSPERVSSFNSQLKQLEDALFLVPNAKHVLTEIRRAKNACFWEDSLKHLQQVEEATRL